MRWFTSSRDRSRRSLEHCTTSPTLPQTCGMVKAPCPPCPPAPIGGGCYARAADGNCAQQPKREERQTPTNLIVAIDFTSVRSASADLLPCSIHKPYLMHRMHTQSNAWQGKETFDGRNLHDVRGSPNPYETVLKAIAAPLERVGTDHKIHAYGFGDGASSSFHASASATHAHFAARCEGFQVFSLFEHNVPASGYTALLHRYRQVVPHVKMAGPTNYAPVIQQVFTLGIVRVARK